MEATNFSGPPSSCLLYPGQVYWELSNPPTLSGWIAGGMNHRGPCTARPWLHVNCSEGSVVGLDLSSLKLSGALPASISMLAALQTINFQNNAMTGRLAQTMTEACGY